MSFKAFDVSWITLRKKLSNSNLEDAVRYWCAELKFDKSDILSIERNIHEWIQNSIVLNLAILAAKQFEFFTPNKYISIHLIHLGELKPDDFKQCFREKQKAMERQNNIDVIMLIAFVLVGVGFLLHRLDKISQQGEKELDCDSSNREPVISLNQKTSLVLVINADRNDLINSLEEEKRITEANWEELYNATQFLWIGTASEFSSSDICNYFSKSNIGNFEPSEYDVHFIRIDLSRFDLGFQPDVLQIDRRDAFQRLPETSREISISPRLSSEAYSGKGFYNR